MKNFIPKIHVCLFLFIAAVSACNSIPEYDTPTVEISSAETMMPTRKISTFTPTISPSLTSTTTPISTIPPDKANEYVLQMLRTNGNCEFPCWWGISPGISSWDGTRNLLAPIASVIADFPKNNGNVKYEVDLPDPEGRSWNKQLIAAFYVNQSGIIDIMSAPVEQNSLQDLIKKYGIPTEAWVSFIGDFPGDPVEYFLALYYPKDGIMAIRGGSGHKISLGNMDFLRMCSDEFGKYSQLLLWSPKDTRTFYDIAFAVDLARSGDIGFGRIGDVSELDENEFANKLLSTTNFCFETPYDKWPIYPPSQ
jgi:hypothetical protein